MSVGLFDRWRKRPPAPSAPTTTIADGVTTLREPLTLTCGVLPIGTRVRSIEGTPEWAELVAPLVLPRLTVPAGTTVELDRGPGEPPSVTVIRLTAATIIAGLELPAKSEIEIDRGGEPTGVVLGARLDGVPGPAGLTWDRGAFIAFVDGTWELDPFPLGDEP